MGLLLLSEKVQILEIKACLSGPVMGLLLLSEKVQILEIRKSTNTGDQKKYKYWRSEKVQILEIKA
jgi:hypothetical protein